MAFILQKTALIFTTGVLAILSFAFCMGGIVPDDFVESKIKTSALFEKWRVLGPEEWTRLSERALFGNNLSKAEQTARAALARDLTNGGAAAQLAMVYFKQNKLPEADRMAERAHKLWPSRCRTNILLAKYWQSRGQSDKGMAQIPPSCS